MTKSATAKRETRTAESLELLEREIGGMMELVIAFMCGWMAAIAGYALRDWLYGPRDYPDVRRRFKWLP